MVQATAEVTIEELSGAGRVRAKKRKVVRHEEEIDGRVHRRCQNTRPLQIYFLFPVLGMASSYRRAVVIIINLFKRQVSRLQETCTLTGTSVKRELTERHPIIA